MPEDMFNPATDLRFDPVELELQLAKRTVSRGLLVDKVLDTQLNQSLVDPRTLVGTVGEKVLAPCGGRQSTRPRDASHAPPHP